jgi:uncharacterized membrane protein YgcG
MRTTVITTLALLALKGAAASATTGPGPFIPEPAAPDTPSLLAAQAAPQQDDGLQRGVDVRVWTEDERDAFNSGDRTRVFVRTNAGAYVAVLHIDTSGNLEVLFPSSPYEDGFLQARRMYSLPSGYSQSWTVRGAPGLGYVFAVASDQPLELRSIRSLFGRQASGGEHVVYGDPYASMQRIARLLVPDWTYVGHAVDWYGYSLGGRFTHPRYACYDSYGSWYYGRGQQYDSCDRVRLTLRDDPNYYDTRYHRADRRIYADTRDGGGDTHGYKVDPRAAENSYTRRTPTNTRPGYGDAPRTDPPRRDVTTRHDAPARDDRPRTDDRPRDERTRTAEPTRERPTLQRREGGERQEQPRSEPRAEPRSQPATPTSRRPDPPSRDPGSGFRSSPGSGWSGGGWSSGGSSSSGGSWSGGGSQSSSGGGEVRPSSGGGGGGRVARPDPSGS